MKIWISIYDFTHFSVLSEVQGHVSSETGVWTPPSDDNNNNYPAIKVGAVILLCLSCRRGCREAIQWDLNGKIRKHTRTLEWSLHTLMKMFTFIVRTCSSLVTGCKRIILFSQIISVSTDLVKDGLATNDSHDSINDWFSSYHSC